MEYRYPVGTILIISVFNQLPAQRLEPMCKILKSDGGYVKCSSTLSCGSAFIMIQEVQTASESCKPSSKCDLCCSGNLTVSGDITKLVGQHCNNRTTCELNFSDVLDTYGIGLALIWFDCIDVQKQTGAVTPLSAVWTEQVINSELTVPTPSGNLFSRQSNISRPETQTSGNNDSSCSTLVAVFVPILLLLLVVIGALLVIVLKFRRKTLHRTQCSNNQDIYINPCTEMHAENGTRTNKNGADIINLQQDSLGAGVHACENIVLNSTEYSYASGIEKTNVIKQDQSVKSGPVYYNVNKVAGPLNRRYANECRSTSNIHYWEVMSMGKRGDTTMQNEHLAATTKSVKQDAGVTQVVPKEFVKKECNEEESAYVTMDPP